jgi:tripartite-type tricarboxylate transporter receptor subunit TctC
VATLGFFDLALISAANGRFQSLQDMLAYAKANPGKLNVATINIGSTQHLTAELLKTSAGVDFQVVPFNGSPAVLTALRGGQVDVAVEILGPMMGQIASKTVRPLAVMGAKRAPGLPDVPTVRESGVTGFNVTSWNALAAPANTPPEVIATLNREVGKALASAELRKQLAELNVTPAAGRPSSCASSWPRRPGAGLTS